MMRCASATACRASDASCPRPRKRRASSSSACTPSETRLMPAARKSSSRAASVEVGLASRVISTSVARIQHADARSMTAAAVSGGISEGVPPPKKTLATARVGQQRGEVIQLAEQRIPPPGLIHALPDMTVEVAIRTLGAAERPVDVEGERLARFGRRRFGFAAHGRGGRWAAICSKARARWVSGCFSSGSISPKLRPWPSGTKIGS